MSDAQKSPTSPLVTGKIHSLFECAPREVVPGEKAKRPGQNVVIEAKDIVTTEFKNLFQEVRSGTQRLVCTIKHDGTCMRILVQNGLAKVYKRLDVRTNEKARLRSDAELLDELDEGFRWVRIDNGESPENVHALSALEFEEVNGVKLVVRIAQILAVNNQHTFVWTPVSELPVDSTYELLGPKIQGDPYGLAGKGKGHWLIRHGACRESHLEVLLREQETITLSFLKDYIVSHWYEGIVVLITTDSTISGVFKVNRGHIKVPHKSKEGTLRLSEQGELASQE